jgi:hypothetical protein
MVVFRPSAVKAHLPGMRDYVTECRDLVRRGGRGRARRERVVSPRASRSRSRGWADDDDRRHPTVLRLPTEPARRTAHTSTTTHPGAHLPPRPRRHRSRQTPPIRYSRPRRTVRYQPVNEHYLRLFRTPYLKVIILSDTDGHTIAWSAHDDEFSSRDQSLTAKHTAEGRRARCRA